MEPIKNKKIYKRQQVWMHISIPLTAACDPKYLKHSIPSGDSPLNTTYIHPCMLHNFALTLVHSQFPPFTHSLPNLSNSCLSPSYDRDSKFYEVGNKHRNDSQS